MKQNLHTHTVYDDGKNTPREMVETAIRKGFDSLGFSGHSYTDFSLGYCMTIEGEQDYIRDVLALKEEFRDRIQIFCGIEFEKYSGVDISSYEYAIGSVHYFAFGEERVGFDRSAEIVETVIRERFGGDGMAYAKAYYRELAELPSFGSFDIIGHFDTIAKHCEKRNFFDVEDKTYLSYAFEAAAALKGKIPFFEVNTGAISRGYRTTPYPSIPILKELHRLGFGATISSDCHDAEQLDCYFDEAAELLKYCGFKETYIFTENGFVPVAL